MWNFGRERAPNVMRFVALLDGFISFSMNSNFSSNFSGSKSRRTKWVDMCLWSNLFIGRLGGMYGFQRFSRLTPFTPTWGSGNLFCMSFRYSTSRLLPHHVSSHDLISNLFIRSPDPHALKDTVHTYHWSIMSIVSGPPPPQKLIIRALQWEGLSR